MRRTIRFSLLALITSLVAAACGSDEHLHRSASTTTLDSAPPTTLPPPLTLLPGMPPVTDPTNIYAAITPAGLQPRFAASPRLVIVPSGAANRVTVIDADTKTVIREFRAGREPQHVVPSYDLTTAWVLNNQGNTAIAVDPMTGEAKETVRVDDPYNLYFTPDGRYGIVVAERYRRLDYYSPDLKNREFSLRADECEGINHGDWSIDGRYALFTCEFAGRIVKVDSVKHEVVGYIDVGGMPQDVRAAPNGRTFYVADMMANGVHIVDGDSFRKIGFIETGIGAHGLTISRDAKRLFVANRGTSELPGRARPGSPGSLSIVDIATNTVTRTIPVPDGGSPDMGNLSVDGNELWLGGRFDSEVYVFSVAPGQEGFLTRIGVPSGPHGVTYLPQPGRYSLGHTGNMR